VWKAGIGQYLWISVPLSLTILSCGLSIAQEANKSPTFSIEANVNRVLLPVVVRDRNGRVVSDLKQEDFHVFDNDKPRSLSAFMIEKRLTSQSIGREFAPSLIVPYVASKASTIAPRYIVFLFDDMHLSIEDLAAAKKAGTALLAEALVDSDVAAVASISGKINSGLTQDRVKLRDAIMNLQPRSVLRPDDADCPKIDYYQADLIENKHDPTALQDVMGQLVVCNPPPPGMLENMAELAARRALALGQEDVQASLAKIAKFVHAMATLPGQRTLILVSPGFLTIAPESISAESHIVDLAAQSDVTISTLDARGVYITEVTASDDARGRSPREMGELRRSSMTSTESVMRELADGTGGTYFRHSNDLEAGFKNLTDVPECVYMLELSLDEVKQDGSYHRLSVKVNGDGLSLQVRRGYFAPKPEKKKK
jgi:VWFA-related protein